MSELIGEDAIAHGLAGLPDWERHGDSIVRAITSDSFPAAIELVDKVAVAAEALNHHPDIDIRWRTVTYTLSTHSAGGLTSLDLTLAAQIDALAR